MRRILLVICLAVASVAFPGTPAQASNPIVGRFAADPSMLVANGRVYVYATDDASNSGTYWDSAAWRVYSSADLTTWTDHGAPFAISGLPRGSLNPLVGDVLRATPILVRSTGRYR